MHVEVLAVEPRPIGSAANDAAERYIAETLETLGWEVSKQRTTRRDVLGDGALVDVTNVVGRSFGTSSTGSIVLIAHYDTVPQTPGANDNGAAVGALLETARALHAGLSLTNDITLLFTDGEEPIGRAGAMAFLADRSIASTTALVVNLGAGGGSGPALLAEVSGPNDWMIAELAAASTEAVGFSALTAVTARLGDIGTDFDPFRNSGFAGFHFAYARGAPIYHTAADSIEALGRDSLQHQGSLALGISSHFGDLNLDQAFESGSRVDFFTVGPWFIHYPGPLTSIGLVAALVGLLAVLAIRHRSGLRAPTVLAAMGRLGVVVIAATIAGTLVWMVVAGARPTVGVFESYLYLATIVGALAAAGWLALRRTSSAGNAYATVGMWLTFAALSAAAIPGAAYVFVWPALVAVAVLLADIAGRRLVPLMRLALVAAPAVLLTVPVIDSFFIFAQPRPGNADTEKLFTIAVPLLFAFLLVALVAAFRPARSTRGALAQPEPLATNSVLKTSLVSSSSS
ncbi:MAG: M28 family peptidase [Acidimicrobiia bacterium]|nr:M28 family peptidase [Acidimicrobiia bacterium]